MESVTIVQSAFLEELHAAFAAITQLETIFLENKSDVDMTKFHSQIKHLSNLTATFYGQPTVKEAEEILNKPVPPFVPCGTFTFHDSVPEVTNLPDPVNYEAKIPPFVTPIDSPVQMLEYPVISSVQFSLVDERTQLQSLIQRIRQQTEMGVYAITMPKNLAISAICIALRDCEYLIDLAEIPTALQDLMPIFADPKITKVVHNASQTCRCLHMYGIQNILNVFCITTAALSLDLPTSLEELTAEFRHRLGEGWIRFEPNRIAKRQIPQYRSKDRLSKIVIENKSNALQDWRFRPFSLIQMRLARQCMHYLLYMYDSLRLKLKDSGTNLLRNVLRISHQKASMDWSKYRFCLYQPNSTILCALYQQPDPNQEVFKSISALKTSDNEKYLNDPTILWLSLDVPTSPETLEQAIIAANPPAQQMFSRPPMDIPLALQYKILAYTNVAPPPDARTAEPKKAKTLDDTITELGWLPVDDISQSQQPIATEFQLETTVSPRYAKSMDKKGPSVTGAFLKHLRDPNQPTSVSQQIDGIPQTEAKIFALANNVRLFSKMQGKTKAKLPSGKDDPLPEDPPEEILHSLVSIGYIDYEEARQIKSKISAPKPQRQPSGQRRARTSDNKPSNTRNNRSPQQNIPPYKKNRT